MNKGHHYNWGFIYAVVVNIHNEDGKEFTEKAEFERFVNSWQSFPVKGGNETKSNTRRDLQ